MELTKDRVHDSQYLKNIKNSGIENSLLLGDRGYISEYHQMDLFESCGIELQTPMRSNQKDFRRWPKVFKSACKRVEVIFSQLCDQMTGKRNYAKSFDGLRARIISKIASVTFLQYLNKKNNQPLNHIKHVLSA